ncbi:MAG TPA: HIT domain-containing protein, partial [Verrucomicrobiae bacterium]|nr:HIT domain-containing protein [Verrucomicrobiae bacterium]
MDCELCKAKDEAYRVVYKDDLVFVIMNIEPVKHGHLMILPIRHVQHLSELNAVESEAFLKTVDACMRTITRTYEDTPLFIVNGWK